MAVKTARSMFLVDTFGIYDLVTEYPTFLKEAVRDTDINLMIGSLDCYLYLLCMFLESTSRILHLPLSPRL